jgi:hypothetical protein
MRDADPEAGYLLGQRLAEALDAPFRRVVQRVPGKGDLPAVRGDLDDASAALGPQVGKGGADEGDGPGQVGGDDVLHLCIGELLGCAEKAVAGVAHDGVDPAELGERAVDDLPDRGSVGDVEDLDAKGVRVPLRQVGDLGGVADSADDAVTALEQLGGELAAEAAADAGDEPGTCSHGGSFRSAPLRRG